MRNLLRKSVLLKVLLGVLVLLMYAPPSSAIAGVRRRAVRRTAIVVGSTEKSAAEKQEAGCAATGGGSTAAAGGYGRSGSVSGSRIAGFRGIGCGGQSSCEGCQQCIPEVATATTGRAAIALQTGADQRKRIQRLEAEDPEFTCAVSRIGGQPMPAQEGLCSLHGRQLFALMTAYWLGPRLTSRRVR